MVKVEDTLINNHLLHFSNHLSTKNVVLLVTYLAAWLAPVILSWLVASYGLSFSDVGILWQGKNVHEIAILILLSFASGILFGLVLLALYGSHAMRISAFFRPSPLSRLQNIFIIGVTVLSGIGLYKSFRGNIFEKAYTGPTEVWLGYGAWSITYLFAVGLIVGDFVAKKGWNWGILCFTGLIFLPFVFCGSRVDFLSILVAEIVFLLVYSEKSLNSRVIGGAFTLLVVGAVCYIVGMIRYSMHSSIVYSIKHIGYSFSSIDNLTPHSSSRFYLSTIGDIGVSVFQVFGLLQQYKINIGLHDVILNYAWRLLPGSIFQGRPGDFVSMLPENIGGGSLHALGEGYLIHGIVGCVVFSGFFGILGAISICAGEIFKKTPSAICWLVFAFPWLILIRGGWYQFYSVIKSIEILFFILFLIIILGKIDRKLQ